MIRDYQQVGLMRRTFGALGRRSRSDIENFRDRQVREIVAHAYANVPFYHRLYDEHGVTPSKVRGMGDLPMLPTITKQDLQRTPIEDSVARRVDISRLHARRTSGTSGEPLTIRRTPSESRLLRMYYFQAFRSIGVRPRELAAGVRLKRPGSAAEPEKFLRRVANKLKVYPTADLIAENPAQILSALKELAPEILGDMPGRLSYVASRWSESDLDYVANAPWPRLIVLGGERLTSSVRSHLSQVFRARVLDMYSSVEFNLIASECPATGAYHVADETVAFEILDGNRVVQPGEVGQPVCTALHSFASPLIRYPLGDLVTAGNTQCECGVSLSTITNIQGRVANYFELPDGLLTHNAKIEEAVAFAAPWVRQTQVSQPAPDILAIRVAPLRDSSAEDVERLRAYIDEFLDNRVKVDVIIDSELAPEDWGKFRSVIRPRDAKPTTH